MHIYVLYFFCVCVVYFSVRRGDFSSFFSSFVNTIGSRHVTGNDRRPVVAGGGEARAERRHRHRSGP
jgi:hypothetical protein